MKYFSTRSTIRQYLTRDIDNSLLDEMLEAASHAPTTGGMQLYSAVVTRDAAVKGALAPCHFNQPMVTSAPVVITFCADFNRFNKWCLVSGAKPGFDNFESFVSALLDVTIFAQQFNTIAEMNGLGCCYIGTTTYNARDIAAVLHLPAMVVPVVTLTVGYPAPEAQSQPAAERLPLSAVVHSEVYHDYDDDAIKAIYSSKESLPANRQFVIDNGVDSLAQVFTDVRYPGDSARTFSRLYYDFIASQGFPFPD